MGNMIRRRGIIGSGGASGAPATLLSGPDFNRTVKQLADISGILRIAFTKTPPAGSVTTVNLAVGDDTPVLAWYDVSDMTVRIYSRASRIYANANSSQMFANFTHTSRIALGWLDTSRVTNMSSMFAGCAALIDAGTGTFDTSMVRNMNSMFAGCRRMTTVAVGNFITSLVSNMGGMFSGCTSLPYVNVSGFVTAALTDMSMMFSQCESLRVLDLSEFITTAVTDMNNVFYGCTSLESLDMSSFNTSRVRYMNGLFSNCTALRTVYVGDQWSTGALRDSTKMFSNNVSLVGGHGTAYTSEYTDATYARIDSPGTPGYFTGKTA